MRQPASKSSLSPARARLIERMQRLHFGTIESLVIRNGDPVVDPAPRFVRDVKFGAKNGPRPESNLDDFVLKDEVREFLLELDRLRNGTIRSLQVRDGLPFVMRVEEEDG